MADYLVGLGACLGDVLLSGFVSIYFEKVLKSKASTYSVWDRNFQLAVCSIAIYLPLMLYGDLPRSESQPRHSVCSAHRRMTPPPSADNPRRPLRGWSAVTGACALLGAAGGVLVALSIKHTDSIMKTIATTGSIVRREMRPRYTRDARPRRAPPDTRASHDHARISSRTRRDLGAISAQVLTTVTNAVFLDGPFTLPIAVGALIVVISVFNYNE